MIDLLPWILVGVIYTAGGWIFWILGIMIEQEKGTSYSPQVRFTVCLVWLPLAIFFIFTLPGRRKRAG